MHNDYIKLQSKPALIHPGYPVCGACNVETEFDEDWVCPSCGTSWPSDNMEQEADAASLYEEWSGEELTGPECPNDFAWRVAGFPPNERDVKIANHNEEEAKKAKASQEG